MTDDGGERAARVLFVLGAKDADPDPTADDNNGVVTPRDREKLASGGPVLPSHPQERQNTRGGEEAAGAQDHEEKRRNGQK